MKAAVLKGPGLLELDDLPDPLCPKGGALLEIKACAVCGTDVKMREHGHRDLAYPRVLGHEMVGKIVEMDANTHLAEGDKVQLWPGIACGKCRSCLCGADNRCPSVKIMGFNCDGGFAQLLALPKESFPGGVNLLPGNVDPALAALAEPLACCINGQEQACVSKGECVLIYGGGPIGALHALLAELHGADKIIVAERLQDRIRLLERHTHEVMVVDPAEMPLRSWLAAEAGGTVDVILTATPQVRVDGDLLKMLSPGGRVCIFSGPAPGNYQEQIDLCSIHYHELTITGSYGCASRHNRQAVELLTSGMIKADWLITKRTNLAGIEDAFSHSSKRAGMKSVVLI
ncbi:MAG: alcohol dehydrogenase catalytic domain-containing protein [Methanothrix sp.]|jgi:L-iditol 2-dehydrogenase|nr:alcohol dehydrogenase catalytic domain-containing protein [Methanothrix sp.]